MPSTAARNVMLDCASAFTAAVARPLPAARSTSQTGDDREHALLPQLAIAEFIESGGYEQHLRRIRRAYAAKVAAMGDAVERYFPAGTRVTSPAGGHVLWVQLPQGVDSLQLYKEVLALGITVAPGCLFGSLPAAGINVECGDRWDK